MKLCKHSIDGSRCQNYFTCKEDHVDVKSLVQSELESQQKGKQWPLSSFGPFINKPSIPDYIEDQSFEEIRSMYYDSNMTFIQSAQKFLEAINDAEKKMQTLLSMNNDVINKLANIYDVPENHFNTRNNASQNSIFDSFRLPFSHTKPFFVPIPQQSKKWVLSGTLQEQDQPIFGRRPKTFKINCEVVEEGSGFHRNEYKFTFPMNNTQHSTFGSSQMHSNAFGFSQMQTELNTMSSQQKHQQGTGMLFGCSTNEREKKQQNTSNAFVCSQQQQVHGELDKKQQNNSNLFGSSQQQQVHGFGNSHLKQNVSLFGFDVPKQKSEDSHEKFVAVKEKIIQQQELEKVGAPKKQQQTTGLTFGSTQVIQEPLKLNLLQNESASNGIAFGLTHNQKPNKMDIEQKDSVFSFGSSLQIENGIKQHNTNFANMLSQKEGEPKDTVKEKIIQQQELEKVEAQKKQQQTTGLAFGSTQVVQEPLKLNLLQNGSASNGIAFGLTHNQKPNKMDKEQKDSAFSFGPSLQIENGIKQQNTNYGFPQKEGEPKDTTCGLNFSTKLLEKEKVGAQKQQDDSRIIINQEPEKIETQQNQKDTEISLGTPYHQNIFGNINPGQNVGHLCVQPYGQTGLYGVRLPQQLQSAPSISSRCFGSDAPSVFNGTQSSITNHQCDPCKQHLQEISAKLDGILKVVKENQNIFEKQKNEVNSISELLQSWNTNFGGGALSKNIENKLCVPIP